MGRDYKPPSQLGITIKMLREREKLTLRELADRAGIAHADIFNIECGKSQDPQIGKVIALARAFDVTLDELVSMEVITCPTCGGHGWVKKD